MAKVFFQTVGELRQLLEGSPDNRKILPQVIPQEGPGAWSMWVSFTPEVPNGTVACLQMEHTSLKTLPEPNNDKCTCKEFHGIYADTKICCTECNIKTVTYTTEDAIWPFVKIDKQYKDDGIWLLKK